MRNFTRVSHNRGMDHRPAVNPSSDKHLKPNDNYDDFRSGLIIHPDDINDVFWITYDVSDGFLMDDLNEYLDVDVIVTDLTQVAVPALPPQETLTGDENRVTNDEVEIVLDIPTDEINNEFLRVVDCESDLFLKKIADDVSSVFDEFDDDKGELLVTQETDSNLREAGVRVKDGDHDRACRVVDRQPLKRTKTGQELTKSAVLKDLNEADMEMKLIDVKRKIRKAYKDEEKKKRKIKVIDYIPVPQPQTTLPKKPCKKKDCLSPRRNSILVNDYVPKKPRTCLNKKDDFCRLENDYEDVPVPKKPRTSLKKKNHDFLRMRNDNDKVPVLKTPSICDQKRKDDLSRQKNVYVQVPVLEKPCYDRKDESSRPKKRKYRCASEIVLALPAMRKL